MTGRYAFRYGLGGEVIAAAQHFGAPWAVPNNETFLPQYLKDAGYGTAMFGKWHLGLFKNDSLPMARGFDEQSGFYMGAGDHFKHETEPGTPVGSIEVYDWHVNQTIAEQYRGQYREGFVRDNEKMFLSCLTILPGPA